MLYWLKRNADARRIGHEIYERIVAQARHETFFRDMRVPDTMNGRFEMIVLHLALILERLKSEAAPGQRLGQRLIEHLMADTDDALRQVGIGDMGVPRRVKKAAAALAERSRDYRAGLGQIATPVATTTAADDGFQAALLKHVYDCDESTLPPATLSEFEHGAVALARYARSAARHLATLPANSLFDGQNLFVPPKAPG